MTVLRHERLRAGEMLAAPSPLWALVVEGAAILETAQSRQPVGAGDAVLVDARTAHRIAAATDADIVHADLQLVAPSHPLPSPLVVNDFSEQHPGVAGLVRTCPLGGQCQPFAVWYAGLVGAAMILSWQHTEEDDGLQAAGDGQVAEVVAALSTRPGDPWTLDRMASLVHLSRSALTERFRRATGRSPMRVLRELRMHRARKLLGEDAVPVTQVAFTVGYGSVAAFSRAFASAHDGIPPQEWRRSSAAEEAEYRPVQPGRDRGSRADQQEVLIRQPSS